MNDTKYSQEVDDTLCRVLALLKNIEWAGIKENLGWECCHLCGGHRVAEPCRTNYFSSRVCSRGTPCCIVYEHHPLDHQEGCELAALIGKVEGLIEKNDGGE